MKFKLLLSLVAALSMSSIAGCGGGSEGQIRLVNVATDYAALDLYKSDDDLLIGNVASDTASGYHNLEKDGYTFKLKRTSTGSTSLSTDQSIGNEDHKTLLAYTTGKVLKALYLSDDEDGPSSSNDNRFRVFNTSSETGTVDIYLTEANTDLETVVPDVQAGLESMTAFSDLRSGTYRLRVTALNDKTDVRLDIPNFTLNRDQVSTLVLSTSTGGVLINGMLLNQQNNVVSAKNPSARVRLVADAANKATVSATVNGVVLGTAVPSPQVGAYTLVPATTWDLNISINGGASSLPTSLTPSAAAPGADYTLLVMGSGVAGDVTLITDDNRTPTIANGAKIRLLNGVNGLGALTLRQNSRTVGTANVATGTASIYSNLAAAEYDLDVLSPTSTAIYSEPDKALLSGGTYTVFMLGEANAPTHVLQRDQ